MHECCTQLMPNWDTNSRHQSTTLQTAQHCIYSRYLHPEKVPLLSLSNERLKRHTGEMCSLLTTTCDWTWNNSQEEERRQNNPIKYSQLVAPDLGPSLAADLISSSSPLSAQHTGLRPCLLTAQMWLGTGLSTCFSTNYLGRVWRKHRICKRTWGAILDG